MRFQDFFGIPRFPTDFKISERFQDSIKIPIKT